MLRQSSVILVLMSLMFCTWLWIVQLHPLSTQDMITTTVEVNIVDKTSTTFNSSVKNVLKLTDEQAGALDIHNKKQRHVVPRFMLDLYEKATAARQKSRTGSGTLIPDVVRSLTPRTTASVLGPGRSFEVPSGHCRHLLVFDVPGSSYGEVLQYAELRLLLTTARRQTSTAPRGETGVELLVHIYLLQGQARLLELDARHVFQRYGDTWLSFNVTAAVRRPRPISQLPLLVHIRVTAPRSQFQLALVVAPYDGRHVEDVQPLLLLSYSVPTMVPPHMTRVKRDAEDYEEESNNLWDDDRTPVGTGIQARRTKRQRNTCRRRPLYVDFSEIHYDTWIVAPDGYEAFQCSGKCFFPVSEHLSPTKHAIVQTLLHSVAPGKVPRACCVPTRLEPISVLYIDQKGVLTYRFSYQDMVVAECGCR